MYQRHVQLSRRARCRGSQRGFTLVELIVATGLALVALAAVLSLNRAQLYAIRNQARQNDLQMTARNIVDLFSREVRGAGGNPTCASTVSTIADAKQQLLRIQNDLNGDGATTGTDEDVTYQYKFLSNRFERVANGSTDAFVEGVDLTGSRIRYFDGAGAEVTAGSTGLSSAQRGNVRRVRIELVMTRPQFDPQNPVPLRLEVANDIDLRNRYFVNATGCP